jgi:hypothetical protein
MHLIFLCQFLSTDEQIKLIGLCVIYYNFCVSGFYSLACEVLHTVRVAQSTSHSGLGVLCFRVSCSWTLWADCSPVCVCVVGTGQLVPHHCVPCEGRCAFNRQFIINPSKASSRCPTQGHRPFWSEVIWWLSSHTYFKITIGEQRKWSTLTA